MKNYFGFSLEGKKLLPIWLLFIILIIAPYGYVVSEMTTNPAGTLLPVKIYLLLFAVMIIAYVFSYFFAKMTIENIVYAEKKTEFHGSFGSFLGVLFAGLFLTIITIGIYGAWFMKNMMSYFVDNTSYGEDRLSFKGKGSKLFVIMLLSVFLPVMILSVIMGIYMFNHAGQITAASAVMNIIIFIIMIPFYYLLYKWMVDVDFKGYHVSWQTSFWPSCGKIALEMLLSVITLGIYSPLAGFRLYSYFAGKTVAISDNERLRAGYDLENMNDFLFMWGQILLTVITATIYFPWAYSKIGKRIAGKSYLTEY